MGWKKNLTSVVGYQALYNTLITFLFVCVMLSKSYAMQDSTSISMKAKDITIAEIFEVLQQQTGFIVFYSNDLLNDQEKVDVHFVGASVKQVMNYITKDRELSYVIKNRFIILHANKHENAITNQAFTSISSTIIKDSLIIGTIKNTRGEPLTGVTVKVKNSNVGTITNNKGFFRIHAANNAVLIISYLGYESKEVFLNGRSTVNIYLKPTSAELSQIVITGYQKIDKRLFTGSVGKVNMDQVATGGIGDVGKALQGQVAGVAVENTSGTFGTKSKIRIRGTSSISGNREPLWVVDGIVLDDPVNLNPNQLYSGDAATLLSSAISGINPDDIKSIQILKDASATAMYGVQAVNGVIVITTKKGHIGKPVVSYKNNFTITMKPSIRDFHVMNSKQRMEFSEELYDKNLMDFTLMNKDYGAYGLLLNELSRKDITWDEFYNGIQKAKTYNTDWFDVIFKNALIQEHSVSISSGTEKSQYYASGSYFRDNGQTIGQHTDRFTANLKANFNLSDRFSIGASLYGSARNQRMFGTFDSDEQPSHIVTRDFDINPYTYARTTSRAMRPFNDEGEYMYYQMNYAPFNILEELVNNFEDLKLRNIRFQLRGNWDIADNLSYNGIVAGRLISAYSEHITTEESNVALSYRAMDNLNIRGRNPLLYNDPYDDDQYPISVLPRGGIAVTNFNLAQFYTIRNSFNWKPVIGKVHSFDLLVGNEIRHRAYKTDNYKGWGYSYYRGMTSSPDYRAIQRDMLSATGKPYYSKGSTLYNEVSFFANLAYSFHHRYNLTLSARTDGSNRLGASKRFRFLPIWVIGGSWNADEEEFLSGVSWIDHLRVRGSYGLRGNIGGLGSPEMLAYYGTTTRFEPQTVENVISVSSPDLPSLQWEKENMLNVALEIGFLDRISATFEYYDRHNYDLVGNLPVSQVSGFTRKFVNWADMRNRGIEITLNTDNVHAAHFDWRTVITMGYNKNEVLDADSHGTIIQATSAHGFARAGYPVNGLYSFRFAGLDEEGLPLFYNGSGKPTNSITKYSRDLGMLEYEGSRDPLASGGVTNIFSYKNFSFSALFTYAYGNKIRLNPIFERYYSDVSALDASLAQRWEGPGQEKYTNIPRIVDKETRNRLLQVNSDPFTFYNRSNIRVADGSFVRFKNVMLSYTIPSALTKRIGIQSLKIDGQAQNLMLWADPALEGQDPEALIDGISIPPAQTFTFGITVKF